MLSITECVEKTKTQRQTVEEFMDTHGYFDASECNVYDGLKRSIQRELQETLRKLTLRQLLKEYLATPGGLSTGSLGQAGANYLVPTWLSQKLYSASRAVDLAPLVSTVFEPRGSECTVATGFLRARMANDGTVPFETVDTVGPKIKLATITVGAAITTEMIEDNEFGIVEWHVQKAGEAIARRSNDQILVAFTSTTATDGYGSRVTGSAAAGETLPVHIFDTVEAVSRGDTNIYPICDTMITTPESWSHSIATDTTAAYFPTGVSPGQPTQGFHLKFHMLDTVFSASTSLCTGGAGAAMTACKTVVFDRTQAMVTARKSWLRVENYADPISDLAGAVITGRQHCVAVVECAIGVLTET